MELKIKLKIAALVLLFFVTLIMVDWFKNVDYTTLYNDEICERIPQEKLSLYANEYIINYNAEYALSSVETIRKSKTPIPFVFKKELVSSTKKTLIKLKN